MVIWKLRVLANHEIWKCRGPTLSRLAWIRSRSLDSGQTAGTGDCRLNSSTWSLLPCLFCLFPEFPNRKIALGGHRGPDGISSQMWRQKHFVSQPTWSQQMRAGRVIRVMRQHGGNLKLCTWPSRSKSKSRGKNWEIFLFSFLSPA